MSRTDPRERWRRIETLFEEALDLPEEERRAFVAGACPDDPDLAAEVVRMLAAHETGGGLLDRPPGARGALLSAVLQAGAEGDEAPGPVGSSAGPYRVVREVGRGGMGVVYEAWDERLRRPLALKFLPASLHADAEARARFLDEARAASALEHPAICTIYDLGETDDGRQFIAMAYYRGRTLEDRLRDGPVPVARAIDWALQVADGLGRAHEAGIVHRDVKPSNLLVIEGGEGLGEKDRVKILDFGVAKLEGAATATVPGSRLGTPAYMAPEQARGEQVDGRADLFSLGAVLYEMVTGRRALTGATPGEGPEGAGAEAPPPLHGLRPDAPEALEDVVRFCLAPDRDARYASAAELVRDLTAVRDGAAPSLPARAAAPATPELPAALTRFVGREREVEEVLDALDHTRLLTLTGPGGTGKTRLAVEAASVAAERFPDSVRFVSLAALRDPAALAAALCAGLGVAETPTRAPIEALQRTFGARRCLLVLDNLEQVVEAAPVLADLLARCPGLKLLVTSRVLLRVSGERVLPVPPLGLPADPAAATVEDLERAPATALFLDRARAARADFTVTDEDAPDVARICRRLDGLPLAIELAAARVRHFSPESLLSRLGRRLEVLGGGPRDTPVRHQTLREAVLWSYELLEPWERTLFRRLGTFAEGFTLASAETLLDEEAAEIAGTGGEPVTRGDLLDGLAALLDHSLIHRPARSRTRSSSGGGAPDHYAMLDTLRELAFERLEKAGERDRVARAHARTFLKLAEDAAEHLTGPEQARWVDRLVAEHGNLEAALDRAEQARWVETALRLGAALWRFWLMRGDLRRGRDRLERLVSLADAARPASGNGEPDGPLARVLQGLGTLLSNLGDNESAVGHLERSLELFRRLGDRRGLASQLNNLGWVADEISDLERARELSEEALKVNRDLGDLRGQALALNNLGWAGLYGGDYETAHDRLERSLELRRRVGDRRGEAFALTNLAWAEQCLGRLDRASDLLEEAARIFEDLDDRLVPGWTMVISAVVARGRGDHEEVVRTLREAIPYWTEPGNISGGSVCFTLLARSLVATAVRTDPAGAPAAVGPAALEEARDLAETAEEMGRRVGSPWLVGGACLARAEVELAAGDPDAAGELGRRALATFESFGGRPGIAESRELLDAVERARSGE
ncbi:MAG: tetratricopeptide repeat protein [Acidobacteriota bacterium]|jgi:non-specific serine/threonine protein kinase